MPTVFIKIDVQPRVMRNKLNYGPLAYDRFLRGLSAEQAAYSCLEVYKLVA